MDEKHFSRVHLHAAAGDGDWFDERQAAGHVCISNITLQTSQRNTIIDELLQHSRASITRAQDVCRRDVLAVQVEKALQQAVMVR